MFIKLWKQVNFDYDKKVLTVEKDSWYTNLDMIKRIGTIVWKDKNGKKYHDVQFIYVEDDIYFVDEVDYKKLIGE